MRSKRFKIENSKIVRDASVVVDSDGVFEFPHHVIDKNTLSKYVAILNYLDCDLAHYKFENSELKDNYELIKSKYRIALGNRNNRFEVVDCDEIKDTLVDMDTVWCFDEEEAERCVQWLNDLNDLSIKYKQQCEDYEKCYDDIGDLLGLYKILTDFTTVVNELQSYFPKGSDLEDVLGDDWPDLCRIISKSRDMLQDMDIDLITD